MTVQSLPAIFSSLNVVSFIFMMTAYFFIKKGNRKMHGSFMLAALVTSTVFLMLYLIYHFNIGEPSRYQKTGLIRYVYFTILISHTILSVIIVPLIFATVYQIIKKNYNRHKAIAKWTLPIWSYVSVTGVIVYLMLWGI